MPDADEEFGAAGEPTGEEEAAPGSGAEDDADEEEKDEHPASSGDSAIEAATIVSHPPPGARCRSPFMRHLYRERAINLKAERRGPGRIGADFDGFGRASAVVTEPAEAAKPVEVNKHIPGTLRNGPRSRGR